MEAIKELKSCAKSGSQEFWINNAAQIVSVLLEAFQPESNAGLGDQDSNYVRSTGLTPPFKSHHTPSQGAYDDKENGVTGSEDGGGGSKAENMHIACKALLIIVKYRNACLKNLMDLLVSRLCTAASFAPVSSTRSTLFLWFGNKISVFPGLSFSRLTRRCFSSMSQFVQFTLFIRG